MQKVDQEPHAPPISIAAELAISLQTQIDTQTLCNRPQKQSRSMFPSIKKSKKRVRFDSEAPVPPDTEQPSTKDRKVVTPPRNLNEECHSMLNLRTLKSFGSHLNQLCASTNDCKVSCLGFLEMRDSFKFIFYNAGEKASASQSQGTNEHTARPLSKTLKDLNRLQRLSLALRLAKAVLYYHSTPWLPEEWRIHDLSFFGDQAQAAEDDLAQQLQSLHLSTQFPPKPHPTPSPIGVAQDDQSIKPTGKVVQDLYYTYGIKNMTLAGLGLALLEIGHQKDIGSFKISQPHDVITARILMERSHTQLGGRYHKIAQRCLDCDFSLGGDLNNEGLQSAVYSHVVCELEELIKAQKRFEAWIA